MILTAKRLTKKYDGVTAVDAITFHVNKGDIYGIVGPNGAGKSTTIHMITGLLIPDNGEILYEDNERYNRWHSNIGLVPQDLAIYTDLSAEENVSFFASLYGLKGDVLKANVDESLKAAGLEEHRKKRAGKFSGGMKRRLNIACATAHKPRLLIMDEPTVGIDPQSRTCFLESIRKLQQDGATIIYTSHYMEEVEEICSRILIMDHGKIITHGTTSEVKHKFSRDKILVVHVEPADIKIQQIAESLEMITGISHVKTDAGSVVLYCGEGMEDYASVFGTFQHFHIPISGIESKTPTLEEVFLSLTGKELRDE